MGVTSSGWDRRPAGPDAIKAPAAITGTLEFLLGEWALHRTIDDRRGGVAGEFTGTAAVELTSREGWVGRYGRYEESGTLSFGAHRGPAWRTLCLLPATGGAVDVRFADGRSFFTLDLGAGSCTAEHPCVEDLYVIEFAVLDRDTVEERWRVRGPAKDYDALTVWRRGCVGGGPVATHNGGRL